MSILPRHRNLLVYSALLALTAAVYFPALSGGFVYDDHLQVEQNPFIRSLRNIPEFFRHSTGYFQHPEEGRAKPSYYYRPLHMAAYAVTHALGGRAPWAYHLANLLLAVVAACLVFWVGRKILPYWAAVLGAVVFTVLPVHAEPVVWIAALPELLSAVFFLYAFGLHLKPSWQARDYAASGLCLLAAFLTRENTLVFPLLAAAWDVQPWGRRDTWNQKELFGRYLLYALALAAYGLLRTQALGFVLTDGHYGYPLTRGEIAINLPPLLVQYFSALFVPPAVSAFHIFTPAFSGFGPMVLGAEATLLVLLALGIWLWRHDPVTGFLLLWLPITLLPFLYLPGLGENIFTERYLFLPSAGFSLLAGYGLAKWFSGLLENWKRAVVSWLAIGFLAWWAGSAAARGFYWQDDIALARQTLRNDPQAYHFVNVMAYAYYLRGDLEKATLTFASLESRFPVPRLKPGEPLSYAEVRSLPRRWNGYQQSYFEAQTKLAALDYQQGRWEPALARYEKLAAVFPGDESLALYLGLCYEQLQRSPEAMAAYQRVLQINPGHRQARQRCEYLLQPLAAETENFCSRAKSLLDGGHAEAAAALLQEAARKDPSSARPYHYLFNLYWLAGDKAKARAAIREALRRDPDNPLFNYNYRAMENRAMENRALENRVREKTP